MIATLALPDPDDHQPAVAKQWANEKNYELNTHGVTAYAKIAGATWTYYVKDLTIRIGRPADARPSTAGSSTPPPPAPDGGGGGDDGDGSDAVHIDLGPSKLVSRQHAVISYDTNGEHNWQLHVLGRNGVKVDDEMFRKDSSTTLCSGSVIDIGGVQMMFVLPDRTPVIASPILRRACLQQYIVDEEQPLVLPPAAASAAATATTADAAFEPASAIARMAAAAASSSPPPPARDPPRSGSAAPAGPSQALALDAPLGHGHGHGHRHGHGGGGGGGGGGGDGGGGGGGDGGDGGGGSGGASASTASNSQRGVLLELTEDMDYSQDIMKDVKPPYSYALLIAQAILSSDSEQLTLSSIYQFIMDKYAFYRHSNMGWQVSVAKHTASRIKF